MKILIESYQVPIGHSSIEIFYEEGGHFHGRWTEGGQEEHRRSVFSSSSFLWSMGTYPITKVLQPFSFVEFYASAMLIDLVRDFIYNKPEYSTGYISFSS